MQPETTCRHEVRSKNTDHCFHRYYVHSDQSPTLKPVILVPESQFQVLLDEINKEFPQVNISITHVLRQRGFAIDFDDLRTEHRPRYLGCSISRTQHEYWAEIAPVLTQTPDNMGEDRSLKAFKAKMALIAEISCKKNNGKKASAHHDRVVERMEMTNQTLRAQRYLGLLPRKDGSLEESMAKMTIGAIDPSLPSPFPFDQEPIIISFDVEAWEMSPNPITEVGIATLDTRDLKGIAPGRVGTDWQKLIRARHFRILEHAQHKNGRFVDGCPEHFEFGASEFVSKDSIAQVLATCFKHPFSKPPSSSTPPDDDDDLTEERNIVLLGHDITQDINYLAQLGFNVTARKHLLEAMDTLAMHRAYTHDPNGRALGAILGDFDLLGWHLHNAGNDAVYTLWAMLAIAVQHAAERHNTDRERALTEALQVKSDAAAVEARDRVSKNAQGWHPSDGAEDGGVAVPPDEFKTKHEKAKKTLGPRGPAPTGRWTSGGNVLDV